MLVVRADPLRATELACDIRLHKSFLLPPNHSIGRTRTIRVTYSDVGYPGSASFTNDLGYPEGKETPVVLWAGGMFGGRYQAFANDDLCKRYGVRFLGIDRPGVGGTDLVSLDQRIDTWLDMVPALLEHVGVKHVHLAAHSAGTIFVLNTVLHQRHLLHPTKPFVAMFGPWVHPSRSGKWGLSAVGLLPELAIGTWHHWAKMINENIAPVLTASGMSVTKASRASANAISRNKVTEDSAIGDDTETTWRKASEAVITNYVFAENVEGASHEALLCLRKGTTTWGQWRDIDEAVLRIAHNELTRRQTRESESGGEEKLKFQIYFAQNDEMIGKGGQRWLEACFWQGGVSDSITFESEVVPGTDHNDVLALQNRAMEKMVQTVAQKLSGGEEEQEQEEQAQEGRNRSGDSSESTTLQR
jgi:pimeloyl-ACP methyl ester carboxylesterase